MKRILYLSFYFEPDLCAGSFRNTPLAKELAKQLGNNGEVVMVTTMPNRYSSFQSKAPAFEKIGNLTIHRVEIPKHNSGFADQIRAFYTYYREARKIVKQEKFDLVFASTSRLFTGYLGYTIAKKKKLPLYLDVRDIFSDTMADVIRQKIVKLAIMPVLHYLEKKIFNRASHINLISGGFADYFKKYPKPTYSFFTNGIDDEFVNNTRDIEPERRNILRIIYAGNIGEGQGLHTIVPEAALLLNDKYEFYIVGDGGAKAKLVSEIERLGVTNVKLVNPLKRSELMSLYHDSDILFIHLNDYKAFTKVLPSKIFELATYNKPIVAGVSGYARKFIEENVANSLVFHPGGAQEMVEKLQAHPYRLEKRDAFIQKFRRSNIDASLASSILSYLP